MKTRSAFFVALAIFLAIAVTPANAAKPLKIVKGPYLQQLTPDSIVIMWETNTAADSQVDCDDGVSGPLSFYVDESVKIHEIQLTGLAADTAYYYTVTSGTKTSPTSTFATAPDGPRSFRFVAYGDTRTNANAHAAVIQGIINTPGGAPEIVIHTGDLVENGDDSGQWGRQFFGPAHDLMINTPMLPIIGNHEGSGNLFRDLFSLGDNDDWFAFTYGSVRFIGLNTHNRSYSPGSVQYNWLAGYDDGGQWVPGELESDEYNNATWHIVYFHHPPYTATENHSDDMDVQQDLVPLFEQYGVDMVFNGHSHAYERYFNNGIYYIVAGGGGAPLRNVVNDTVEPIREFGESAYHHCVIDVDVDNSQLIFEARYNDGTVLDGPITLVKDFTPPTAPTGLTATAISDTQIDLSWTAASDPETGIDHYNIYSDGQLIDTSTVTSYSDTGLSEATEYTYKVSAVNGDMMDGPMSDPVTKQTLADTTAPTIDSVWVFSQTTVEVVFSEPVEQTSAETVSNYAIEGVSISSATLQGDTETVVLTVSTLSEGVTYTLTVNYVTDCAFTPNTIVPDTLETFEYVSNPPVAHWALDDSGTTAVDSSGNGNDGTLKNGAAFTADGKLGGAVIFDGTDDYIQVESTVTPDPPLGLETFTLAAWFKRAGAGDTVSTGSGGFSAGEPLVTKGQGEADGDNRDMNYFLGLTQSGSDWVLAADFEEHITGSNPGLNHPVTGVTPIVNDQWHHAAVTYDGSQWNLYLDGNPDGTSVVDEPPNYESIQFAAIGAALDSTGARDGAFNGTIDDVYIFAGALIQQEIVNLMGNPPPTASLLIPLDNGQDDLDADDGEVTVNTTQSSFQIQLSDVGDGIDDATVISATVAITKDSVPLTEPTDYSFSYDAGLDVITLTPAGAEFGNGLYEITLTGIVDIAANVMAETTLSILIDTSIVPSVTLSFQQGVDGYSAMVDTMIRWATANDNYADSATQYYEPYQYLYNADTDSSGGACHVLLRFDEIIGPDPGQIPSGSTIVSATLRILSTDEGDGGKLHRMLVSWVDTVVTWNDSFGSNGIQADDIEAVSTEDDGVPSNSSYSDVDLDVTAAVQDWADGIAVNNGWAILPNGTGGWHMAAAEHPTLDYRPELIVTFTTTGKATNPSPTDGALDVLVDADLNWTAGSGATSHDVYFGTSSPGTLQGNQAGVTFVPVSMNYETTYYWRIDEVGPAGTAEGEVWSFTTVQPPPLGQATNPIPDGTTLVAVDADLSWTAGEGATLHDVYFGTDSANLPWVSEGQSGTIYDPGTLEEGITYYWRIDEVGPGGVATGLVWSFTTYIEAPVIATLYIPLDGATGVGVGVILHWFSGDRAASHDVYFGIDPDDVFNADNTSPEFKGNIPQEDGTVIPDVGTYFSWDPLGDEPLPYVSSYYWRIDEINPGGVTESAVWNFTTEVDTYPPHFDYAPQVDPDSITAHEATITWETTNEQSDSFVEYGDVEYVYDQSVYDGTLVTFHSVTLTGTLTGLEPDTTYYYRVTSTDNVGNSATEENPLYYNFTTLENTPPVAVDDSATTNEDTAVVIDVLANDSDADGDTLSVGSVTQPTNGSVVNNGANVTYTPNAGFDGIDTFTYTASDGYGGTAEATVTITVNPVASDVVTIIKAEYRTRRRKLTVQATSSQGSVAVLTVFDATMTEIGTMTYDAEGDQYQLRLTGVADPGATITVESDLGGSATAPVTHRN
jgi:predicted phosphodiesterase